MWKHIQKIEIITTDDGPLAPDVFWLLHGTHSGCVIPQGATGESELLEWLQALPGFDNGALIEAMGSTSNAVSFSAGSSLHKIASCSFDFPFQTLLPLLQLKPKPESFSSDASSGCWGRTFQQGQEAYGSQASEKREV